MEELKKVIDLLSQSDIDWISAALNDRMIAIWDGLKYSTVDYSNLNEHEKVELHFAFKLLMNKLGLPKRPDVSERC